MKKTFTLSIALLLLGITHAIAGTSGPLTYALFNSTEIQITDCQTNASGSITIPTTLEGKPVTAIGSSAFYDCSSIASVIIPDTLTIIGGSAFKNCTQLKRAIFKGDAPSAFGSDVFDNTAAGFKIYYADDASDFSNPWNGYTAESYDSNFSFEIISGTPETITITDYPLALGSTEIDVPSTIVGLSVTTIGAGAFDGQMLATRISLPDSITRIEQGAFYECIGLTTFTIPANVTFIGDYAFEDAYHLDSLFFEGNAPWRDGDIFVGRTPKIHYLPGNEQGFEDDDYPWANIEKYTGLYDFDVVAETIKITNYPNTATGGLTIPETIVGKPVSRIGEAAFYGCDDLTRITLPENLTQIYREAFENCSGLTTLTIPTNVTSIGDRAYSGCTLDSVFFEGDAPSLGSSSLGNTSGKTVYYLDGKTGFSTPTWHGYTAEAYTNLFEFIVVNEEIEITDYPTSPTNAVVIPAQIVGKPVTIIDDNAFNACNMLSVTLPSSVKTISHYAFAQCDFTTITIPSSVTSLAADAFTLSSNLIEINVNASNPNYASTSGVLFNKAKTSFMKYPEGKDGDYQIPTSVTAFWNDAFSHCDHLYSVMIPEGVTTIGNAFQDCSRLTLAVFLGNAPAHIGSSAFLNTADAFKIYYPNGKTGFTPDLNGYPTESFDGKFSLEIHSVFQPAFPTIPETLTQSIEITDYPEDETGDFIIPRILLNRSVEIIGESAFENSLLDEITIPDSITKIEGCAFSNCVISTLTIPDSVTEIGDFAFYGCTNLEVAVFEGDAPSLEFSMYGGFPSFYIKTSVFDAAHPDFMIYYFSDQTGYSSPSWEGYPASEIDLSTHPLALWLLDYNIAPLTDINMDPNGDGVDLLMEYALNLNPTENNATNTPQLDFDNPQPGVISIWYYANQSNVTYTVDTSTNLQTWTTNGVTLTPLNGDYRAAWTPKNGPKQFLRLRVEAAAPAGE